MRPARHPTNQHQHGFTLIEVLIAAAVLALLTLSFSSTLSFSGQLAEHHRQGSRAVTVGERLTEELLMMGASDVLLVPGIHGRGYNREGIEVPMVDAHYLVSWRVSLYEPSPGIRQIEVTVTWTEKGRTQRIQWTTYRT